MTSKKISVIDEVGLSRMLMRISHEIVEKHTSVEELALVGIWNRGVHLARRIARNIQDITGVQIPVGTLDITFYRDDLGGRFEQPLVKSNDITFDIGGKNIVIIDDVLYTGRTVRAAMDAIMDYGRPRRIMLAVLIDRGHRQLPIRADIVGKNLPTMRDEEVQVYLKEVDGSEEIAVLRSVDPDSK